MPGFQIPLPSIYDYVIAGVALLCLIISWYYFFTYFRKIKFTQMDESARLMPVSLVVAARNEFNNLEKNIPLWLGQDYPEFELIIADDGSTDGTADYIAALAEQNPKIKLVLLDPLYVKMHGKKIALTLAYKKARYNQFVLTDADCTPASDQWLKQMASKLSGNTEIVLGYSPYERRKGLLNKIIRYETVFTALHYIGYAMVKKAYMGVGRNLAYTRNVYDRNNGFASHSHVPAGDDDLFVQQASNAQNTAVCLSPESFCYSIPKKTFKEWRQQKRRHMWVGKFYTGKVKQSLAWFPISQIFFLASIVTWFFLGAWFVYPLGILILKWIPEWIIFGSRSKKLGSGDLSGLYPIFNLFYSVWYIVAGIRAFFAKKPKW